MHVERKPFLLLAASIAACTSQAGGGGPIEVAAPLEIEPLSGEPLPQIETAPEPEPVTLDDGGEDLRRRCRELKPPPGPHCESFEDTRADCETYADVLEEDSARRATLCLARRSGGESICRVEAVEECFNVAIRSAEPDPEAGERCRALVTACASKPWSVGNGLSLQSCARAFATVKLEREAQLLSCISEGCGLASCIWVLADG